MLDAAPAPAPAPAFGQLQRTASGGAGIDATRVLNLFGYVGPVASLMSHALLGGSDHRARAAAVHVQRLPAVGDGRPPLARVPSGLTPGKTRFVLSATEDAMDSVLPTAAERMFRRAGRFGNASAMQFRYDGRGGGQAGGARR